MTFLRSLCFLLWLCPGLGTELQAASPKENSVPAQQPARNDAQLCKIITGTWANKQRGFAGTVTYRANGTWECYFQPENLLMKMVSDAYSFEGTWNIKGGLLFTTFTRSSLKSVAFNTPYKDELLQLDLKTLQTRNQKGMVTIFTRQ